ncbi:peptidase [Yinghuangia seranimata]|uniref:peptidase n=1 Tax=Yinghuangia seranimata TaxID=408067 RepID=UPI00248CC618|nr:peptidase [Yinghuangia seranimata]MDI2127234.1 peptidase [Yinghuangia seranimata]
MRSWTRTVRRAAVLAAAVALTATPAMAASSSPSPSPSGGSGGLSGSGSGAAPGTSFLTAGKMESDASTTATASTGEYMYWSFPALAGEDVSAKVTLTLPGGRTAASTWRVDVFDGIRRHQPCATGHPQKTAQQNETDVTLDCGPRTIRPWSEAWSADPLPGLYYVRVAATDIAEKDVGLKLNVKLELSAKGGGDIGPDAGQDDALKAPLMPITKGGTVLQPGQAAETRKVKLDGFDSGDDAWLSGSTGRWVWTTAGGIVAMLLGVGGYMFARHPRRWFR